MTKLSESVDIAIVGAGPAGIAAADVFQQNGYSCVIVEADCLAGNIAHYPTYMTFFSTADKLEIGDFPFTSANPHPSRREYLFYLARFCRQREIRLRLYERVHDIQRDGDELVVHSRRRNDNVEMETRARRVVIATGAYDTHQPIGCPGEDLPKVSHYYAHEHAYVGTRVLVIGGGNTACEAALELWRAGVQVSLAVRKADFGFVKYWVLPDARNRIAEGAIAAWFRTRLIEIRPDSAVLQTEGEEPFEIENDFVLALTGYEPDTALLERCGIAFDAETKRPHYDEKTLETNVTGIHVAGVIAAGNVSAEIFIENSREHGFRILDAISRS